MNEWYIDNDYHIDIFFNTIYNFITYNSIIINIPIDTLYNKFIYLSYKGSFIPFKNNSFKKYKVKKKWYNEYYDITLGNDLFNLIHNVIVYIQETNKSFLNNICTHSIQNFFEQYIQDKYNEINDANTIHNNDTFDEDML
jgi:hypothetical protein